MAGRLTARKVETAKAGKYSDGGNLYLIVSDTGTRKWVLRFTWRGKAREMGLGTPATVSLADAREKAAHARRMIAQRLDPIAERKRTGDIPTFGEMADQVREALSAGFRNEKHKAQWKSTLATYAAPLADKPVDVIGIDDVLAVLRPIWGPKEHSDGGQADGTEGRGGKGGQVQRRRQPVSNRLPDGLPQMGPALHLARQGAGNGSWDARHRSSRRCA